jgi:hypothetical protein
MNRPDPIQYAERLYGAIRAANFSPISFLAFGNAVKEGIPMRNMPRIAVEPFMRIVGEMLDLEEQVAGDDDDVTDADVILAAAEAPPAVPPPPAASVGAAPTTPAPDAPPPPAPEPPVAPAAPGKQKPRKGGEPRS